MQRTRKKRGGVGLKSIPFGIRKLWPQFMHSRTTTRAFPIGSASALPLITPRWPAPPKTTDLSAPLRTIASTKRSPFGVSKFVTTFNYNALARILMKKKMTTKDYVQTIISLFENVLNEALDDIILGRVDVSEGVIKSIITEETLSSGHIKTILVTVFAKHLKIVAPALKKELARTKFVEPSLEFMKIMREQRKNLFDDLKTEFYATIIGKLKEQFDALKNTSVDDLFRWNDFEQSFKVKFIKTEYSSYDKIEMMYYYSFLSYHNTIRPKELEYTEKKIPITDFAKSWYSSTTELLSIWSNAKKKNPNVLTINVLISAIDLSIPTLIDEYCNYWNPKSFCARETIKNKFETILRQMKAEIIKNDWFNESLGGRRRILS